MNQLEFETDNVFAGLKKSLGDSIKSYRKSRRLSQEELAVKAGLHRTYVVEIESGRRNLTLTSIAKLAGALDVSLSDLFSKGSKQKCADILSGSYREAICSPKQTTL